MFSKTIFAMLAIFCVFVATTSALQMPKPRGGGGKGVKAPPVKEAAPAKKGFNFLSFGSPPPPPPAPEPPKKKPAMGGVPKWASDFMRQQNGGL